MNTITLPQLAWYDARKLELTLPESWQVEFYNMAGYNRPAMTPNEIKASLTNLIDTPPIRELARGKNEVVIIFDDMTRVTRVAKIVSFVLEELSEAGISDDKIRFVAALGCHGAMDRIDFIKKLGEETVARFPVYNHNAFGHCIYVGDTGIFGTKVYINEEVMKCDLKIAIGSVVPHPMRGFGGFGGGGKIIMPGVAAFETIKYNHEAASEAFRGHGDSPVEGFDLFDNNPHRADIEEAAALAGLDVLINCIVNMWGETVSIFGGALIPTYLAAVNEAKTHYITPKAQGENIVIANSFAKASEAGIGLRIALNAVSSEGGDVVLIANAPEGQVTHYLTDSFGRGSQKRTLPPNVNHLITYTEYPEMTSGSRFVQSDNVLFLHKWDEVIEILQKFNGENTRVAVFPNADIQI